MIDEEIIIMCILLICSIIVTGQTYRRFKQTLMNIQLVLQEALTTINVVLEILSDDKITREEIEEVKQMLIRLYDTVENNIPGI